MLRTVLLTRKIVNLFHEVQRPAGSKLAQPSGSSHWLATLPNVFRPFRQEGGTLARKEGRSLRVRRTAPWGRQEKTVGAAVLLPPQLLCSGDVGRRSTWQPSSDRYFMGASAGAVLRGRTM